MLRLKKIKNFNPYLVGDRVEFYNIVHGWVKGTIIDFVITDYVFKAKIKCDFNEWCKYHYICICSKYLRKC